MRISIRIRGLSCGARAALRLAIRETLGWMGHLESEEKEEGKASIGFGALKEELRGALRGFALGRWPTALDGDAGEGRSAGGGAFFLRRPTSSAREVFEVMGKRIIHCGLQGAGQTVKACNQILCALNMMGICVALHLAQLSGIDPGLVVEALTPGGGRLVGHREARLPHRQGDFNPGFMVDLIQKDVRIVQDTALARKRFGENQEKGEAGWARRRRTRPRSAGSDHKPPPDREPRRRRAKQQRADRPHSFCG